MLSPILTSSLSPRFIPNHLLDIHLRCLIVHILFGQCRIWLFIQTCTSPTLFYLNKFHLAPKPSISFISNLVIFNSSLPSTSISNPLVSHNDSTLKYTLNICTSRHFHCHHLSLSNHYLTWTTTVASSGLLAPVLVSFSLSFKIYCPFLKHKWNYGSPLIETFQCLHSTHNRSKILPNFCFTWFLLWTPSPSVFATLLCVH